MKINSKTNLPSILSSKALKFTTSDSDLLNKVKFQKSHRRKSAAGVKLKRDGASSGRRSRPETPLLHWKLGDGDNKGKHVNSKEERSLPEFGRESSRNVVSARKLAAVLWRIQLPEVPVGGGEPKNNRLGFQHGGSHIGVPFRGHPNSRGFGCEGKDLIQSSRSVSVPRNENLFKFEPLFQYSNPAMEGVTKWDPICSKISDEVEWIYGPSKHLDQQASAISVISALKVELEQAQARIHELETERRYSKKKLEQFLKKLSEERATWRSREHEKIRAVIDDIKAELSHERKNRQRLEIVNSKLVCELTDAKVTTKRYLQDYEKERKDRELIEEVCDELANEIGEDKAEVEALKRESFKLREEVDEERKMLQMAEVWREERVQMKLVDAKVTLEEKYSQINKLIVGLETFLSSRNAISDLEEMRKAEFLLQTAASVSTQEIKEFAYEPPNGDDIFSIFENVNFIEANEREIEPYVERSPASHVSKVHTVSPEANMFNKDSMRRHSNAYLSQNGDIEDGSEWETVSHLEDHGSSYSPEGSDPSINKIRRDSNVSRSVTEWEDNVCEETPITEISEVSAIPKKVSSISRLWRSCPGENFKIISMEGMHGRLSNGRLSNGASISPDGGSGKGRLSSSDLSGQWSPPDSGNPHITRGMKGCIEWPRGMQKSSLKAKLLEARMESQKIQLRQVLKQKI